MEMCLYYPLSGYYNSPGGKIGRTGDFYTASTLSSVFGSMIARQMEKMWAVLGKKGFSIVEYGAGTGTLCHDILSYAKNNRQFYESLQYYIIEKSPAMRAIEKTHLADKVIWLESIQEIGPFKGCVLSNELVDNLSVHQVCMQDRLMEVFVSYGDGFKEQLKPAGKELIDYFDELGVRLPEGYHTEVNLEATEWIREIAESLEEGFVITIDYGYTSGELYSERRRKGTMMCYHQHMANDECYGNIGKQDITTHVNFSALSHWGSKHGLSTISLTSQAEFFISLGFDDLLSQVISKPADKYLALRQYALLKKTFLLDMGQKYKVLMQAKSINSDGMDKLGCISCSSLM
jgi:SAM-dependent MidA family methyltransferase